MLSLPLAPTTVVTVALAAFGCGGRDLGEPLPSLTGDSTGEYLAFDDTKLDLLLVVDNSRQTAKKHEILARSLPGFLVDRLALACMDEASERRRPSLDGTCPAGTTPLWAPFSDVHVGVITTSLGGHGGFACSPAAGATYHPEQDERGELIAPLRGVPTPDDAGFLSWRGHPELTTWADVAPFTVSVAELVEAVGERGCGFEAPLEAWYRFLIDPMPPLEVVVEGNRSVARGLNAKLLEQRARFLRPDSVVAILMLTDEDDCSVRDDGPGYFVAGATPSSRMPRGTSVCAAEPEDICCRSCALVESGPPAGCAPLAEDPACAELGFAPGEQHANVGCYEQQRRFGLDFRYPTARYAQALHATKVYGRACDTNADCPANPHAPDGGVCTPAGGDDFCEYGNPLQAQNPHYAGLIPRAGYEMVFLGGILGVPWQDLATEATRTSTTDLELVPASGRPGEESLSDRWELILGEPSSTPPSPPLDPFMWGSIEPRLAGSAHALSGLPFPAENPLTGDVIAPSNAPGGTSPINGHELQVVDGGALQSACAFALDVPRPCPGVEGSTCACSPGSPNRETDPRCQPLGATRAEATQYFDRALPGPRLLEFLRGYGLNSSVGSACPKSLADPLSSAFGYRAALEQLVPRRTYLDTPSDLLNCLAGSPAPVDAEGQATCSIAEITQRSFEVSCATPGRAPAPPSLEETVRERMRAQGRCDNLPTNPCDAYQICALTPASGDALDLCLGVPYAELPLGAAGYCAIDASNDRDGDGRVSCEPDPLNPDAWRDEPDCLGDPALVSGCPERHQFALRILSRGLEVPVPYPTSVVSVSCRRLRTSP